MQAASPAPPARQHTLTAERKKVFLDTLAETGSTVAAAQAATPWAIGEHGGLSTFRDERKRDPRFAMAWERAMEAALARVETEIMRRAMTPTRRPVFSRGELKDYIEEYDNRLLLRVASRLNPEWSDRQRVEHSGDVDHRHAHLHAVAVLDPSDIMALDEAEQTLLIELIEKIDAVKDGTDG